MDFKGKVAIVTGGAGGIGGGIARAFATQGATVCVADMSLTKCDKVAADVGDNAFGLALDVTSRASIDDLVREVISRAGGVDILINNAGIHSSTPFVDVVEEDFDRIFAVNARGYFFVMQAVARQMVLQGRGGKIVNISSGAGRVGLGVSPVYSATKAAAISFSQSAARTLIPHRINVNSIAPGSIATPMLDEVLADFKKLSVFGPEEPENLADALIAHVPARRMGEPEDIAAVAMFLCSTAASYIVGQTWNVDGGSLMN